jgi:hypothetical protein
MPHLAGPAGIIKAVPRFRYSLRPLASRFNCAMPTRGNLFLAPGSRGVRTPRKLTSQLVELKDTQVKEVKEVNPMMHFETALNCVVGSRVECSWDRGHLPLGAGGPGDMAPPFFGFWFWPCAMTREDHIPYTPQGKAQRASMVDD